MIESSSQSSESIQPSKFKGFLRGLGFVIFGGPLILLGLYFGWMALEEGTVLVVLVAVLWIATGIAFGRHAASGFARRSLLTAGVAIATTAVTIQAVTHLQDRGSRSLSELLGGAYMFFFLVWAVIALPTAMARGLRRIWRKHKDRASLPPEP